MIQILSRAPRGGEPDDQALGVEFCRAAGLTAALPAQLLVDAAGRPFEPVKLTLTADPAALAEQVDLLMREQPIGGWQGLVQTNRARALVEASSLLRRRLGSARRGAPARTFLCAAQQQLRTVGDELAREREQLERAYVAAAAALRGWQEQTRRQPGLFQHVVAWLAGSAGTIGLPQAIARWNEREQLALRRDALEAAAGMVATCGEEIGGLRERLDALREEALRLAERAQQSAALLARPAERYSPWSWRCDVAVVTEQLAAQGAPDELVPALLERLGAADAVEQLGACAGALAREEAARRLAPLDIAGLIEAEARAMPADAEEPLVLVGKGLLGLLERQPTWRLARTARVQRETLQITASGEPLFQLDGLGAAAYGGACDRFGFVQVELGAALDDLLIAAEGGQLLAEVLSKRNCFVLEALALAWEQRQAGQGGQREQP